LGRSTIDMLTVAMHSEVLPMIRPKPYAELKHREVKGQRMAYIDEGDGDAIVFQHGQPGSSYVWRNVMPHLEGLGRLIACDLIGMGGSAKLDPQLGPDRYRFLAHREYLASLWDALALGDRVILVLDDWGAALGFDWAHQHAARVQGIVYMEPVAVPLNWSDLPEPAHPLFRALRSATGEDMVLNDNIFIETVLPRAVIRSLSEEEMEHYRRPFSHPGEDRRPTLSWPRSLPIDAEPREVVEVIDRSARWLAHCQIPKLFVRGDPGTLARGRVLDLIRTWPNQTEVTVKGRKLLQEDSPDEIGGAIAKFVRRLRNQST